MQYMTAETHAPRQITLEEYEALIEPDEWISEVSKGWLVREPRPNAYHGLVVSNIHWQLKNFLQYQNLGRVILEAGYRLSDVPLIIRGPDLSFIRHDRMPTPMQQKGLWPMAPDLAIEVLSPSNTALDMQLKVLEYFDTGVGQVWIIDPFNRLATVYRSLTEIEIIRSPNSVIAGPLLPGFELQLGPLFE